MTLLGGGEQTNDKAESYDWKSFTETLERSKVTSDKRLSKEIKHVLHISDQTLELLKILKVICPSTFPVEMCKVEISLSPRDHKCGFYNSKIDNF